MTAAQCPDCGARRRRGVLGHDRSCPQRHGAQAHRPPTIRPRESGPLTTPSPLPESAVLGADADAAEWLAYVGLGGRYAFVRGAGWQRWTGKSWRPAPLHHLRSDIRLALQEVYDRQSSSPHGGVQLTRLLDVNWSFRLTDRVRAVLTVDAAHLGEGHK